MSLKQPIATSGQLYFYLPHVTDGNTEAQNSHRMYFLVRWPKLLINFSVLLLPHSKNKAKCMARLKARGDGDN